MKNITTCILVGMALTVPALMTTSCSTVSQVAGKVSSIDMSKYPGLNVVAKAQEGMMAEYGQSAQLLLSSRQAALNALALDADAYAEAEKAGAAYEKAKKIAAGAKDALANVNAQIQNVKNSPDFDVANKAVSKTSDVDDIVRDGYKTLSEMKAQGNSNIAAANAKGDAHNAAAVQHVAKANAEISKSYSLLQQCQLKEAELTTKAAIQSAKLIKGMEGASTLQKAALATTFRPIVYFLTQLPGEIDDQNEVKSMWEEHSKQASGLVLPAAKQLPNLNTPQVKTAVKEIATGFVF